MLDPNCWAAWWHLQLLEHSPATLRPWQFGRPALYVLKMIFRPQCRQKKLFMLLRSLHILTLLNNSIFLQSRRWLDNCFAAQDVVLGRCLVWSHTCSVILGTAARNNLTNISNCHFIQINNDLSWPRFSRHKKRISQNLYQTGIRYFVLSEQFGFSHNLL